MKLHKSEHLWKKLIEIRTFRVYLKPSTSTFSYKVKITIKSTYLDQICSTHQNKKAFHILVVPSWFNHIQKQCLRAFADQNCLDTQRHTKF